ncbi:uncharacterized protein SPSK_03676 [Sporothrix schenckii 1099-18]|uniref:Uncharacterized protein n=2 Tax=Sporothrix schenckii TaxID=29908 RepID=U7PRM3_SPOS1|nr:uncharacterized protein SPSK_03676 [Sporothrix schenckii 1099-18]ERS97586.1 hypothetical protein HMPREF1624_05757 [Sporothrix schenckii ATCC 58251]KJR82104.1 membrane protein [Sporothrix schenckii 1099-18]
MSVVVHNINTRDEETPLLISVHSEPAPGGPSRLPQRQQRQQQQHLRHLAMASMFFWRVGALYGATAVALGAFGAHGLKNRVSDPAKLATWSTAAHYQLAHSVAMLAARGHPVASSLFATGMTLFSGSIYALVLDPERFKALGPVTPVGGLCLILGWLSLVFSRGRIQL